jgi:hypothetical protein
MPNSQRILFWLPAAMVGLLLAAGSYLNYRSWSLATSELEKNRAEFNGIRDANESIKRLIQSAPDFTKIQTQFKVEVPKDPNMGTVLESISRKLGNLNIGGEEVTTEPTNAGPKYSREKVTLRFRANGGQTQKVLEHIAESQRLIRIDKLTIAQAQDGGAPMVEIQFSAFSRPMEEASAWLDPR